jgi:hypothetical protein
VTSRQSRGLSVVLAAMIQLASRWVSGDTGYWSRVGGWELRGLALIGATTVRDLAVMGANHRAAGPWLAMRNSSKKTGLVSQGVTEKPGEFRIGTIVGSEGKTARVCTRDQGRNR